MPEDVNIDVTVALITRNRCGEVARALASVMRQEDVRMEVLLHDDASQDGTSEMVARDFPTVDLRRVEEPLGCAGSRNETTRHARGEIVFYMDDDAYLPSTRTLAQVLADFDDPRVAVVAVPFHDHEEGQVFLRQQARSKDGLWVLPTFTAAAYAVRKAVFEGVGGYQPERINMYGEEADLTLRLLDAGYVTRAGRADPAQHEPSPVRSLYKKDVSSRRNELVWCWSSFPAPWHVTYVIGYIGKGIIFGVRTRRLPAMLAGLREGLSALRRNGFRAPVSRRAFRIDRRLRREVTLPLEAIAAELPPLVPEGKLARRARPPLTPDAA